MVPTNSIKGLGVFLDASLNIEDIIKIANRIIKEIVDFNQIGKNTILQDLIKFQLKYIPPPNEKGNSIAPPASIGLSPSIIW